MKELKGCLPTLKLTAAIKASPSSYSDDGKISLIGHGIDSIDEIPPPIAGTIRILFLSNNLLQDLSRIDQFRKLRQLSVANNNIKYFDQIQPLQSLECLERLSLIDNPVTQQPYYFDFVVELCRSVIQLDGRPVTTLDSVRAKTNCSKLDGILNQLLLNEIKNSVSLHLLGLLRCQREMKSKYFGLFR